MPDLVNENKVVSKDRLITVICLIMILEHRELSLKEIINATGMSFHLIRAAMQNLVNLRLVEVIPTKQCIPRFKLLSAMDAKNYLKSAGVSSKNFQS